MENAKNLHGLPNALSSKRESKDISIHPHPRVLAVLVEEQGLRAENVHVN